MSTTETKKIWADKEFGIPNIWVQRHPKVRFHEEGSWWVSDNLTSKNPTYVKLEDYSGELDGVVPRCEWNIY